MEPVSAQEIREKLASYLGVAAASRHHRYRSWEHCYRFFSGRARGGVPRDLDPACLQLGFYLASWGMYRGSSFLLQHDYRIHAGVIERIDAPEFSALWQREIGLEASDREYVDTILAAVAAVKEGYRPYGNATDTLATKVLLGTLACLPACDRFFVDGFKRSGRQFSYLNGPFVRRVIDFCALHHEVFCDEQRKIVAAGGIHHPVMKLVDMYFWQIGYDVSEAVDSLDPPRE